MNKLVLFASLGLSILIIAFSSYYQGSAIGTFLTLGFTGLYVVLCWWLKTLPGGEKLIDGYPLWTYNCSLCHQALVLPVLAVALFYSIDSWESWIHAPISPGTLTAIIHHIINAFIMKDFIVYDLDLGFLSHHLVTIMGCSMCLLVPVGGGYVTANAIIAEVGSSLWNYQVVYPSWFSYSLYVFLFQISNILPTYYGHIFIDLPELNDYQSIRVSYRIMLYILVLLRSGAWIMVIRDRVYCKRSENGDDKVLCGNVECGIREVAKKVD